MKKPAGCRLRLTLCVAAWITASAADASPLSGSAELTAGDAGYLRHGLSLGVRGAGVRYEAYDDANTPHPIHLFGADIGRAIGPARITLTGESIPGADGYRMHGGGGELEWTPREPQRRGLFALNSWRVGGLLKEHTETIGGEPGQVVTMRSYGELRGAGGPFALRLMAVKVGFAPHHGPLPILRHVRLPGVLRAEMGTYPDYSFLLESVLAYGGWEPFARYVYTGYKLDAPDAHYLALGLRRSAGTAVISAELQGEPGAGTVAFRLRAAR
ncbi:MAG: hypothetical protein ABIJ96_18695 [Elusimicrobiota bacterium]